MNPMPIDQARNPDLRLSLRALERAAQRARELAAQTGTAIVVSHAGVIELIYPGKEQAPVIGAHERPASYGERT